jgi:hypothetical protein
MSQSDDRPAVPSPPGAGYRAVASPHRNRLGVVSLILGGVAVATSWLAIGLFFGIAALATGLAARARVKRGEADNRGTAIAGIALGAVAIVVGLVALGLVAADHLHDSTWFAALLGGHTAAAVKSEWFIRTSS